MFSEEKKQGRKHLQRVIDTCKTVEELGLDPFDVEVDEIITVIKRYFPEWESLEEICLDAEAIQHLASIIKRQGDWVKHRSTSLYTDPFLIEEKLRRLNKEELSTLLLKVWHPIIELEQISLHSLAEGMKYWDDLLPMNIRWLKADSAENLVGVTTREDLVRQRLLSERTFVEEMEVFWEELKQRVKGSRKILYWNFVGADTFFETITRAYMTSFLVTYGYASLELHPLEEELFIVPFENPRGMRSKKQMVSVPVALSFEDWVRWKGSTE